MKEKFMIGELAKLFNISTDTIRHYDKKGLLKPQCNRDNSYRYYDVRDFFKLSRILFFKSLDISLEDIKNYLHNKNTENLLVLLKKKEKEAHAKVQHWSALENKIKTKIQIIESAQKDLDIVRLKMMPARSGIFLRIKQKDDHYETKKMFSDNKQYIAMSSWLVDGQIYTSLEKEDLEKGIFNKFSYFIELPFTEDILKPEIITLPKGEYACISFLGPYRDMHRHYEILISWIELNGYEITGNSIEKNIVDYDFSDSEEEYISEIQIPVKKSSVRNNILKI